MRPRPGAFSGTRRGRRLPRRPRAFAASASQLSSRGYARTRPSARRTAPRRPARPRPLPSGLSLGRVCHRSRSSAARPRGSAPPRHCDPVCPRLHPFAPVCPRLPAPPRPRLPAHSGRRICRARQGANGVHRAGPLGQVDYSNPVHGADRARGRRGGRLARCHPNPVRRPPVPAGACRCRFRVPAGARLPLPARHRVDLVGIRRKPNGRIEVVCVELKTTSKDERTHADGYDAQCRKMPTIHLPQAARQHRAQRPPSVPAAAPAPQPPPLTPAPPQTSRPPCAARL